MGVDLLNRWLDRPHPWGYLVEHKCLREIALPSAPPSLAINCGKDLDATASSWGCLGAAQVSIWN